MTANEAKQLFANIPFNTSLNNIDTFANEFAALTQGIDIDTDTITLEQVIINLGEEDLENEINIGAADSTLGFFGKTAIPLKTVSNQTISTATDLATALIELAEIKTVVNSMRTALGNSTGYGLVTLG